MKELVKSVSKRTRTQKLHSKIVLSVTSLICGSSHLLNITKACPCDPCPYVATTPEKTTFVAKFFDVVANQTIIFFLNIYSNI